MNRTITLQKVLKALGTVATAFVVGASAGFGLLYLLEYLFRRQSAVNGVWVLALLLLALLVTAAVHELAHFLGFAAQGLARRLLLITPFVFEKKQGRWRVSCKLTSLFFTGGVTLPDIPVIDSEKKLKSFTKKLVRNLHMAPLVNVGFAVLLWVLCNACQALLSPTGQDLFLVFAAGVTFATVLLLLAALMKNDAVIGDLRASCIAEERDLQIATALYYADCSTHYEEHDLAFLRGESKRCLITARPLYSAAVMKLAANKAMNSFLGKEPWQEDISRIGTYVLENLVPLFQSASREAALILANALLYRTLLQGSRGEAIDLFDQIYGALKPRTKVERYYYQRGLLFCALEDTGAYLANPRNKAAFSGYEAVATLDFYQEREQALNALAAAQWQGAEEEAEEEA